MKLLKRKDSLTFKREKPLAKQERIYLRARFLAALGMTPPEGSGLTTLAHDRPEVAAAFSKIG